MIWLALYLAVACVFFGIVFSDQPVEKAGAMVGMALLWPATLLVVFGMWLGRDWSKA